MPPALDNPVIRPAGLSEISATLWLKNEGARHQATEMQISPLTLSVSSVNSVVKPGRHQAQGTRHR